MNQELLTIIDNGLTVSLWVFLGALVLFLLVSRSRLVRHAIKEEDSPKVEKLNPAFNQPRIAIRSVSASLALAILVLVIYLFGPIPGINNLVNSRSWQLTPLRVTAISWDRVYEGFTMEGEVWNQTEEDMEGITAVISIVGSYEELLDSLEIPLKPGILKAGEPAAFEVSYMKNSPFIEGYRLGFIDKEGKPLRHTAGFDK